MSAVPQFRARESEAISTADPAGPLLGPAPRDSPLHILRDALTWLNSPNTELADHAEVVIMLAEAKEALERANVIARAVMQSEEFLKAAQFDRALEILDEGLLVYPADPALMKRRGHVEEQQREFHCAAAVRTALEEAQWLLAQDRPDLAAQLLKENAAKFPDQPALLSGLEEIAARLPQWEQKRHVEAALAWAATLEQQQQGQAALTILEEALQSYATSEELTAASTRIRDRLADHERQKKLARRLELIAQKIASQSWKQAHALLATTQNEFPGAPELNSLRCEVDAGLRRSECEVIVTEVRQCLADGDPDQAEQVLSKGVEALGPEPALATLREEIESARKYREELRTAQILFGRRQLREAEHILARLAAQERPEAQALLDAVLAARAATEEEDFCERGRQKVLQLMQEGQFAQAADLLRNLLSLFPDNAILERDLLAAHARLDRVSPQAAPAARQEAPEPQAPAAPAEPQHVPRFAVQTRGPVRENAASRLRWVAIAGAAAVGLVSASGAAWKLSRNSAPVSQSAVTPPAEAASPAATPTSARAQTALPELSAIQAATTAGVAPGRTKKQADPTRATPLRQFVPPVARQTPVEVQTSLPPLPPGTVAIISAETMPGVPAALASSANAVPPPAAVPQPAAPAPVPAARPADGGRLEVAQLIDRPLPAYPSLALQRGIAGLVRMEARVDERGTVTNVKVLSGDPVLATTAKTAVLRWKYKAATLNGQPIATNVAIEVRFGDRNR